MNTIALTRREFVAQATAISGGVALLGAEALIQASSDSRKKPPNILFIFSDQQRADSMGCYGQKLPVTPNLDRLADEGVLFERAFTPQPLCGPARASLQTGRYATEVDCFVNGRKLPAAEKTMAHYMGDSGYQTAYVGKWHLASTGPAKGPDDYRMTAIPPERRGGYRDYWMAADILEFTSHGYDGHVFDKDMKRVDFPEGRYRADALTDLALDFLKGRDGDNPFFLFLSFIEPHHQNDHKQFEGPEGSKEKFKDYEAPGDLIGIKGDWRESLPDYLGCCNAIDSNVGRLRQELEKQGILDTTLIVYTSDHGCHFRTRNGEYKRSCHDAAIRIPMILRGPGFAGFQRRGELVSLLDLAPTVLSAAGLSPREHIRGRPLQDLIQSENGSWRKELLVQISEDHVGRAIRTDRWTYSVRAPHKHPKNNSGSELYYEDFLYDVLKDPHQRTNLVRDPACADLRAELAAILKRKMAEAGEDEPEIRPALAEPA